MAKVNRAAGAGAKEVGELAIRFAERNITSSFEFAQRQVHAKDAEEVMALNADYVKRQVSALNDQLKDLTKGAAKMGGSGISDAVRAS